MDDTANQAQAAKDTTARIVGLAVIERELQNDLHQRADAAEIGKAAPRVFEINAIWHAFDPVIRRIVRLNAEEHRRKAEAAKVQAERSCSLAEQAEGESVKRSYLRVAASYAEIAERERKLATLAASSPGADTAAPFGVPMQNGSNK